MMTYTFQAEDGAVHEIKRRIGEDIPQTIEVEGKEYHRVWFAPRVIYNASGFTKYDRMYDDPVLKWRKEAEATF